MWMAKHKGRPLILDCKKTEDERLTTNGHGIWDVTDDPAGYDLSGKEDGPVIIELDVELVEL